VPIRRALGSLPVVALVACATQPGPVVSAPSSSGAGVERVAPVAAPSDGPEACGQSWQLEDATGSSAQILVVCGHDLKREPVSAGPMSRALDPALEVAHERVCTCAKQVGAPASVDLVITSIPTEGHATIEPSDADTSLDPDDGRFLACIGKVPVTFPSFAVDPCEGGGATSYVYSLAVELGR
jgi:hypothetical protein